MHCWADISLNRKPAILATPAIPLLTLIRRQRLQDAALLNRSPV
jgi:hypothetical protein